MFSIISIAGIAGMFVLMGVLRVAGSGAAAPRIKPMLLGRLAMCAMFVGALALAVTGLGGTFSGTALSGMMLMGHMVCSGLFIAGLVGAAVFYAESHRFERGVDAGRTRNVFFWLALTLGLVTIVTALVGMIPLFTPQGIDILGQVHRWSALALVMSLIGLGMSK